MTPGFSLQLCYYSSTASENSFTYVPLIYFHEAKKRIRVPQEEFQEISNELTTTLIELKTKFPSSFRRDRQSRSNKHNEIRGEAFTAERILASCKTHLKRACWKGALGLNEIKNNNSFTSIATIYAEVTGKLVRHRLLYSLLWLLEKWYF